MSAIITGFQQFHSKRTHALDAQSKASRGCAGYVFRVLTAQGPRASGGARDYLVRNDMIGGFAFIAYPVEYAVSGVKTFLVNQDGEVVEKDLGANTKMVAAAIKRYNPDDTWTESPREQ
jgi:hypothetical protein